MCAHVCACARVCTWSAVRPVLWTVVPLEASQSEGIQPVVQAAGTVGMFAFPGSMNPTGAVSLKG